MDWIQLEIKKGDLYLTYNTAYNNFLYRFIMDNHNNWVSIEKAYDNAWDNLYGHGRKRRVSQGNAEEKLTYSIRKMNGRQDYNVHTTKCSNMSFDQQMWTYSYGCIKYQ